METADPTRVAVDRSLWPTARKPKPTEGKLDELGFFYTPNGSFYDFDNEYFNKNGYDIHGGWYTKEKEYISGPDWISELGCYEDEKEKYLNNKEIFELEDEADLDMIEEGDFAGDQGDFEGMDIDGDFDFEKAINEAQNFKAGLGTKEASKQQGKRRRKHKK